MQANNKLREALEIISRTELPPNSHTTEAGESFTFADGNRWLGMIRTFVALAKQALSAPPSSSESIGNNSKIREALKEIEGYAWVHGLWEIEPIAKAALAETPRNCDVGTEREQSQRFDKFCYAHRTYEHGCGDCPLLSSVCCELAWAQLPYKEGDPK